MFQFAGKRCRRKGRKGHGKCSGCRLKAQCALSLVAPGDTRFVACMESNRQLVSHLAAMGILPGTKIDVLSNNDSSMVVGVRGGRVTLSREIAEAIMVA
ncbi:MAG: ferrous iron transport protein A [Desulfoplanes sp.]|nr:ferrous iron transport protein A [Desulfoplanes sp.]MDD4649868.1 ferrous iron transport protein A [Desulfoplanes sp.]